MEWKNDVLSFSGFDYGVSRHQESIEAKLTNELNELFKINETFSSLGGSVKTREKEISKKTEEENCNFEKCDFDSMTERKIENSYFHNVEQAERKMKQLTILKTKWSEPWQEGEEVLAKAYLKPINHRNPWKDGTIQEKEAREIKNRKRGSCVIS